jgi:hypothetical protein
VLQANRRRNTEGAPPSILGWVLLLKLRFSLFDSRYASVVSPALNLNFSLFDADSHNANASIVIRVFPTLHQKPINAQP